MTPSRSSQLRLLFVDDECLFLTMIEQAANAWAQGAWQVHAATSAGQALGVLRQHAMDLVVLDIRMPVVDGLQFLGLLQRKYPDVKKVVLTGYVDETYRAACLNSGAELYLEKPRTPEGLEVVFATLNEVARDRVEEDFRGVLRQLGLQDVIQMECLSRHSSVLEVTAGPLTGQIYLHEGSILHAQVGPKVGEPALIHLLALGGGEFHLKPFAEPPARTIEGSSELLLREAARLHDASSKVGPLDRPSANAEETSPRASRSEPTRLSGPDDEGRAPRRSFIP
jgi:CheY-like chemotaxis protein